MSAKKDVQTRAAVVAAGEQIDAQMSDLSRARARRSFAALASVDARSQEAPVNPRPRRGAWAIAAAGLTVAAASMLALRTSPRGGTEPLAAAVPSTTAEPPTQTEASTSARPMRLTAERVDRLRHRPLSFGESVHANNMHSTHIRFSDGTDVALQSGAELRVANMAPEGAEVHVERGTVSASVVHQSARTAWDFVAGPFRVHVVGTAFDLGWEPAAGRMQLAMREGVVSVEGCGVAARVVRAPEGLQLACAQPASGSPVFAHAPAHAPQHTPAAASAGPQGTPPSMEDFLNRGDWGSAYAMVATDFDARLVQASPDEALRLGDVARMAKHEHEAERAYATAGERGHLALAWLELAKLQLHRGNAHAARASADKSVSAGSGSVVEDAHMLGVEAALYAHDEADARARSQAYLLAFPRGSHADRARALAPSAESTRDAGTP